MNEHAPYIPKPTRSLRERIESLPKGQKLPIIEVRVGSDSDLPKIRKILEGLNKENVPVLVRIASAHRTPEAMMQLAKSFPNVLISSNTDGPELYRQFGQRLFDDNLTNKLQVVLCIAAAGGSAHIAGMTASETEVPVIGFPVPSSTLGQYESDASMRHMPPGIPNGVSAYEEVIVAQAKAIYDRTANSSELIYLSEGFPITPTIQALIEKLGIQVTRALSDGADIGIYKHTISDTEIDFAMVEREYLGQGLADKTRRLGTPISIVNPVLQAPLDTNKRSIAGAQRAGIILENLLTTPGLSMGVSVEGNTNLSNSLLFAAKVVAIHNDGVRAALAGYRHDLGSALREKDIKVAMKQFQ